MGPARQKKILGHPTRGKTGQNRLRRTDIFISLYDPALIRRNDGPYLDAFYVDLGYGEEPLTTIESCRRLRKLNPRLCVLGVEIDPERVRAAQPFAGEFTQFRLGGFNLPLMTLSDGARETVRAIRAFNVLRQYDETEIEGAWTALGQCLLPGGLLLEGTSDPFGRLWVANVLRKPEACGENPTLIHEALVFSTNFRYGFDPALFQPVLPKNHLHRMTPGQWTHDFMEAWKLSARETVAWKDNGVKTWFAQAARALATKGYKINTAQKLLDLGFLVCLL